MYDEWEQVLLGEFMGLLTARSCTFAVPVRGGQRNGG
jgi:hypothetical protein